MLDSVDMHNGQNMQLAAGSPGEADASGQQATMLRQQEAAAADGPTESQDNTAEAWPQPAAPADGETPGCIGRAAPNPPACDDSHQESGAQLPARINAPRDPYR